MKLAVYESLIRDFPSLESTLLFGRPIHEYNQEVLENIWSYLNPSHYLPTGIINTSSNNIYALIRLFEKSNLPGKNAKERLEWILNITSNLPYSQFVPLFPADDSGFCIELADSEHYFQLWTGSRQTEQMGHFLTAVAFGYNPEGADFYELVFNPTRISPPGGFLPAYEENEAALNLVVGHEMIGDQGAPLIFWSQYHAATPEARRSFLAAVDYDTAGGYARLSGNRKAERIFNDLRDEKLRAILVATDSRFGYENAVGGRRGNSLEDFRLTVKGWRFGRDIRWDIIQTRMEAANWLRREVYDPNRTR